MNVQEKSPIKRISEHFSITVGFRVVWHSDSVFYTKSSFDRPWFEGLFQVEDDGQISYEVRSYSQDSGRHVVGSEQVIGSVEDFVRGTFPL